MGFLAGNHVNIWHLAMWSHLKGKLVLLGSNRLHHRTIIADGHPNS